MACELAIVGCGDSSHGDEGAGVALVRQLRVDGVPAGVQLVDASNAGIEVAYQLRGARRVIVVDAASTGAAPGTVFRLPGPEPDDMPPLSGLRTQSFRWDHALAFARWLLGQDYPPDVTVYLIEGAGPGAGTGLTGPCQTGISQVLGLIRRERAFQDQP